MFPIQKLTQNYLSYAVDNEALKIANKIVKSEEWIKQTSTENANPKKAQQAPNQSSSHTSTSGGGGADDEEELDLRWAVFVYIRHPSMLDFEWTTCVHVAIILLLKKL